MLIKVKTYFIVIILISSLLLTNLNSGFIATNKSAEPSRALSQGKESLSNGDFNWGSVEVISEPIVGGNININMSSDPKVVIENDEIYIVWNDNTSINNAGGDYDVFYRYFNGNIWSEIQVISEPLLGKNMNTADSYNPDIAVENGKVYVAWEDANDTKGAGTDFDIFFRCNLTGTTWEDIQVISEPVFSNNLNKGLSEDPAIMVENNKVYVAWQDSNNTNGAGGSDYDIFYRCNLTGSSWENVQVISEPVTGIDLNTGASNEPRMAINNSKIYVVWYDSTDFNGAEIDRDIFYRCNLTGTTWEDIQVISEPLIGNNINVGWSSHPEIAAENDKLYVVWLDDNSTNGSAGDYDIFFRCNRTGYKWGHVEVISEPIIGKNNNIANSLYPDIAVENGNIFAVWNDKNNTNGAGSDRDIFFRCNIKGTIWEDIQVISEPLNGYNINIAESMEPNIAVNFGKGHIVWEDENNTNGAGTDYDIFHNWINVPILPLFLSSPSITPSFGNTSTNFNFSVMYIHGNNKAPVEIKVNISGTNHSMLEADPGDTNFIDGKIYFYNITNLDIGVHTYKFWASEGTNITSTAIFNNPEVYNTKPNIIILDNLTAIEDTYYEIIYQYEDIDRENIGQIGTWKFSSNATWLLFNPTTATLYGTPSNDDVGIYWVNISINDTIDMDFTNFTLTVINENDDPIIETTDVEITYEDELYEVDYNATDVDSSLINQVWSLATNATSWLNIDTTTGIISETPTNDDVGEYWVNVSVDDGDTGLAFSNYTLIVLNVNDRPEIITEDEQTASAILCTWLTTMQQTLIVHCYS